MKSRNKTSPNPNNDEVEVYQDLSLDWRWRRCDGNNGKIVATSGEGYRNKSYAVDAAQAYNLGCSLVEPA
jgi:uncharacterized protein YegP (UPF0339 family)